MRRILINAISVREGGPLVLLKNLLSEMTAQQPDWLWHVAANSHASSHVAGLRNTICHSFEDDAIAGWKVRQWYEAQLPRLAAQVEADLLFSQTNYLPMRRMGQPALLLVQHAGHFSRRFSQATQSELGDWRARLGWRLKGRWVRSSILRARAVTVQTQALADLIRQQTQISADCLHVIPHGSGQALQRHPLPSPPLPGQPVRIGYITKYGVQKNFAVLFGAIARLKTAGAKPILVLTLRDQDREWRRLAELAQSLGISDCLENHGELAGPDLDRVYRSLHVFAFASWCESFGFPLVEAMAYGLPLLVADTPSNRELAGAAAVAFAPDDAGALAAGIQELVANPALYQLRARASSDRAASFTWPRAAAETVALIEKMLRAQQGAS